jgi:hypothetical protein
MWTASARQPLNSGFYTQVGFSHILSKYRTLIRDFQGVIQKDQNTTSVVKHTRAVVSSGTRLRQDSHDNDDDDFDL